MKKILLTLCVCIATIAGVSAQEKGDMAVGLNLGVAPCLEKGASLTNFGIGAKFQYNVTKPIRLEADVDYWFKSKGMEVFDIAANVHYLFNVTEKFKAYPLIGIGYARVKSSINFDMGDLDFDFGDFDFGYGYFSRATSLPGILEEATKTTSVSANKLLVNVGVGAEYDITDNISAGLEIKYQYIKDFSRLPISLGVTYRF